MRAFIVLSLLFAGMVSTAQKAITVIVKDSVTSENLNSTTVTIADKKLSSDSSGLIHVSVSLPATVSFSRVGYKPKTLIVSDTSARLITILLQPTENTLSDVIVSSSRTDTRIENLPTKVEVLGAEEVDEETGIKPGNVASLLGDVAGIQTQQTSAITGNTELRIQGLPGKYTQLLRDGMPFFGEFAGGFGILQIQPLDLKQIEIIKGASSTLYGGGAIAGMINVISKKPQLDQFEKTILVNYSSLNEANINLYLANRNEHFGFTFFTGNTNQQAKDVNTDGYSDVPGFNSFFIHPTLFVYPNNSNTISMGYNGTFEKRKGGDMDVLNGKAEGLHKFYIENNLKRHTVDLQWESRLSNTQKFTIKAIGSLFNRGISTNNETIKGKQLSYYSEAAYVFKTKTNDVVFGANFNGERFRKQLPATGGGLYNFSYNTIGLFAQDDWRIHPKFTVESGLRTDFHNSYGSFVLPRLSLLYKISDAFTTRLGGGLGYKAPTIFDSEIDERDYKLIAPLQNVKAERSIGANWDINFHKRIDETDITINQSFYLTQINDPLLTLYNGSQIYFQNAAKGIQTKGIETYVQIKIDETEIYLGYTLTDAVKQYDPAQPHVELSARNKFASVVGYEFNEHFKGGIEAALTGPQYLDNGSKTPSYWFAAAMLRYDFTRIALVMNCENLFDYRQSKIEPIVYGPIDNPIFKQLWAPIDGRVINLSARIKF
jgi:outer membrane receptor for ferrienterochelin and colicin